MTNYLEMLSKEETTELLNIAGGNFYRGNYISTPKEFSKLKPGFRPDKVTADDALKLALKNADKPFIVSITNSIVDKWLREISDEKTRREVEFPTEAEALASTLLDSVFSDNPDLYFKVSGTLNSGDVSEIKECMGSIKNEREKAAMAEAAAIRPAKQEANPEPAVIPEDTSEEDRETIRLLNEKADSLEAQIKDLKEKLDISEKKRQKNEEENARRLASYDDSNTDISLPEEYAHMSLCEVSEPDYNGQIWLNRLGDIEPDGRILPFVSRTDSAYFDDRDRLFYKNGPSDEGCVGIWNWSTIPNKKDPTKDYVLTDYNVNAQPIEIIPVPSVLSVKELVEQLKNGIPRKKHSGRMLITMMNGSEWLGLLCTDKDTRYSDGCIILKEEVLSLPLYKFDPRETTTLENRKFYRNLRIGIPAEIVMTKNPLEIVKTIVCDSITWPLYKDRGVSRAEWKSFKAFISSIRTDSIIKSICEGCHCGEAEAEDLLSSFTDKAADYLDGSSIDDDVIRSAIGSSTELMDRSKDLVRDEWKKENDSLVSEAEAKLESLKEEAEEAEKRVKTAGNECSALQDKKSALEASIKEKEQLAESVEAGVAERIRKAKENAADFIAEMAFAGNGGSMVQVSTQDDRSFYKEGTRLADGDPDENASWKDSLETLSAELEEAGVKREEAFPLAAYLYSAFLLRIPLLLAGPNADDIADAFSMSLFAAKPGELALNGDYSRDVIDKALSGNDAVICIHNPFESAWIAKLPEVLKNSSKHFLISYPYAEDVRIEPKSLYNYMLPLFTEFFIDKPSAGDFIGGIRKDGFKEYQVKESSSEYAPGLFRALGISSIARYRLQELLSVMFGLMEKNDMDHALEFSLASYAYATMQTGKLADYLSDSSEDPGLSEKMKENILFSLGEEDE